MSCWTPPTGAERPSRKRKTSTAWPKLTRLSRITGGRTSGFWLLASGQVPVASSSSNTAIFAELKNQGNAQTSSIRSLPEHRNHGAHRRRQDHHDRACPVLYGHYAPYWRSA